jgi:hypothetical protein
MESPHDQDPPAAPPSAERGTMLPKRRRARLGIETAFMRVVATAGVVGISVAVAAILDSQKIQGWIIGLAVSLLSVILSAILWSSREL